MTSQVLPVKGDRYLLCSDGLPREVSDAQMASILRRLTNPDDVARELVAQARAHGGSDNITVVVVDVVDDDDRAAAASAALADDPGLAIPSTIGKEGAGRRGDRRPRARFRRSARAKDGTATEPSDHLPRRWLHRPPGRPGRRRLRRHRLLRPGQLLRRRRRRCS